MDILPRIFFLHRWAVSGIRGRVSKIKHVLSGAMNVSFASDEVNVGETDACPARHSTERRVPGLWSAESRCQFSAAAAPEYAE